MKLRIAASLVLAVAIATGFLASRPSGELRDYGSFIASARALETGGNPYGVHPLTFHVVLPGFDVWNPNLNPPISLPFFQLLDNLEPHQGFRAWWILSFVCYAATIALLSRRYPTHRRTMVVWALALAGFWDTLALGQIYLPLVLAAVAGFLLLTGGRPVAAGACIGLLVAVKPNFAVWPVLLLLAGNVRVGVSAFTTAAALSVVPLVLYGSRVYQQWLELAIKDENRRAFLTNTSLSGLFDRMHVPDAGFLLSLAVLGTFAIWAWQRKPSATVASELGLIGAVIASPIAWVHYTLFLLPLFFAGRWHPLKVAAAAMLVVPVPWVLMTLGGPLWQQLTLGSVYNWAVLACLAATIDTAADNEMRTSTMNHVPASGHVHAT